MPNPLAAIAAAAERMRVGAPGTRFVDFIPGSAILHVPLADIEFQILRSLSVLKAGSTLMRDAAVSRWAESYPAAIRADANLRLIEAWQSLSNAGLIADKKVMGTYETWFVTGKGRAALESGTTTYGPAELLPIGLLVPHLATVVVPLYAIGRFDEACTAAFKQLEIVVRELAGFADDVVGVELMRKAFIPEAGPLTLASAPRAEQNAVRDLFVGAVGYFRNPLAHRQVDIESPAQAASAILVANELMAIAIRHYRSRAGGDASE